MLALVAVLAGASALADLGPVPETGLRVVLVRHGQALSNLRPAPALPPEQLDRLTDLGREQSARAAAALSSLGVAAAFVSPAGRARETAKVMTEALKLPEAAVEPRIRPLEPGKTEDGTALTWPERERAWGEGRDPVPPGGESLEQLGVRVAEAVKDVAEAKRGGTVLLVAHSEVVAAYLGHVNGVPAPKRWPPRIGNGSLSVVDVDAAGRATVRLTNHTPAP